MARETTNVINTIPDLGMDGVFGGKADGKIITNEQELCQAL
ncbi:MAG: hypothetical protein ACRBFS_25460 [Aureispira sp.]